MNFISIGSPAPENQTRLVLLFESEFFGQNIVLRLTSSSVVTMATIICQSKYGYFCSFPQVTYLPPHQKNGGGRVKNFHFQLCFTFLENCSQKSYQQRLVSQHILQAKELTQKQSHFLQ